MIGKASEIKTVTFESSPDSFLYQKINRWLNVNYDVQVIDIKYDFAMTETERAESALIIYKEATE